MNQELLNRIHQIHQDLANGKDVELLRLTEKRKVNLDLLMDIHELYYNGHLHLPKYCYVFGYSRAKSIGSIFKKMGLGTLSLKQINEIYGSVIESMRKETNIERFGYGNPLQSPTVREKIKQTNLERYGVENPSQDPTIREKVKRTNLERYGVETPPQSAEIQEKMMNTNLERYGSISPLKSPTVREKIKQTNLERYGVECSLQSQVIREKIKRTNLEKYGSFSPLGSTNIHEKIRKTNLERYGVENPSQDPAIREKVKKTNLEKYGHEYASQSPGIKEKTKQTNLERYGVENPLQNPAIREKWKQTNLERYGVENPGQSPEIQEKAKSTRKANDSRYAKLEELVEFEQDKTSAFVIKNYPMVNHARILRRYGLYQENLSTPELAIREILEKYKIEYLFEYRPKFMEGKELDFYIPNKNLAIEVNGLYWHSSKFKDKYYHQDKHLRCRSEGIQLLSFTEDQILDRLEIIESMILHKLGLTPYRVYAKSCDIREIKTQEAKDFLEDNHLHGFSNASTYLGLEYEGKLVHVMSFGNNRFKKSDHPELIRSASLRFHSVAGGFQRLLKYYKKTYKIDLVESYVDFNISNGQSYELASKNLKDLPVRDNLTEPDLWFVYKGKRYRRQMFMKHNLHKIFGDFPKRSDSNYDQFTVREFLKDRGVFEYYGAGNLRYLI